MPMQDAKLNWGPMHVNSNVIAAIEIRHDGRNMLEFCAVPVNHSYRQHKELPPLHMKIRPTFAVDLKAAKLSRELFKSEYAESVLDETDARSHFENWCEHVLKMKANKKIMPLTAKWHDKKPALVEWLGASYKDLIHEQVRDLAYLQPFIQDRYDAWGEEADIKNTELGAVFNFLKVSTDRNDIAQQCVAYIEAYRKMLIKFMPGYKPKQ